MFFSGGNPPEFFCSKQKILCIDFEKKTKRRGFLWNLIQISGKFFALEKAKRKKLLFRSIVR
jgi:hypothetical protein